MGKLVQARLDVPRFTKVNTVKGRWALLDALNTTPAAAVTPLQQRVPAAIPGGANVSLPPAMKALQKDAAVQIVREAATNIIEDEDTEGPPCATYTTLACVRCSLECAVRRPWRHGVWRFGNWQLSLAGLMAAVCRGPCCRLCHRHCGFNHTQNRLCRQVCQCRTVPPAVVCSLPHCCRAQTTA